MMRRVMVVDDSAPLRAVLVATLKMGGYEVVEAPNGERALATLDAEAPVEVVITDLNMPTMSGVALVRAIRSRARYKHTPILLLTVETSVSQREQAKIAGATGWITKPIDAVQLLATIARVLA